MLFRTILKAKAMVLFDWSRYEFRASWIFLRHSLGTSLVRDRINLLRPISMIFTPSSNSHRPYPSYSSLMLANPLLAMIISKSLETIGMSLIYTIMIRNLSLDHLRWTQWLSSTIVNPNCSIARWNWRYHCLGYCSEQRWTAWVSKLCAHDL